MVSDNQPSALFKAVDAYFENEGLVLVMPDETEAQKAYCEAQLQGYQVRLQGEKLILLKFGVKAINEKI